MIDFNGFIGYKNSLKWALGIKLGIKIRTF